MMKLIKFIIQYSLYGYMWVQISIIKNIYLSVFISSSVFLFHVTRALGSTCKYNLTRLFSNTDERKCGQVFDL